MSNSLSLELIESYRQKVLNDDKSKLSMNSAIHNDIVKLSMNWEEFRKIENEKPNPVIKNFFEKAKKFWRSK